MKLRCSLVQAIEQALGSSLGYLEPLSPYHHYRLLPLVLNKSFVNIIL